MRVVHASRKLLMLQCLRLSVCCCQWVRFGEITNSARLERTLLGIIHRYNFIMGKHTMAPVSQPTILMLIAPMPKAEGKHICLVHISWSCAICVIVQSMSVLGKCPICRFPAVQRMQRLTPAAAQLSELTR